MTDRIVHKKERLLHTNFTPEAGTSTTSSTEYFGVQNAFGGRVLFTVLEVLIDRPPLCLGIPPSAFFPYRGDRAHVHYSVAAIDEVLCSLLHKKEEKAFQSYRKVSEKKKRCFVLACCHCLTQNMFLVYKIIWPTKKTGEWPKQGIPGSFLANVKVQLKCACTCHCLSRHSHVLYQSVPATS